MLPHALLCALTVAQQLSLAPTPRDTASFERRLHLLNETLRVPFGEDWGGETHFFVRFDRLDIGVFARAWADSPCDRPDCAGRAVHAGAEVKVNVSPGLDVGVDLGAHRGSTERGGALILPRLRLKF